MFGMSKVEAWILLVVAVAVFFVILITQAHGKEGERGWAQEIEEKLRALEDCSYIERFRGSPEEQDALSLCQTKRARTRELRRDLQKIKHGERKFGIVGDVKRRLDITSLKVQTWLAVEDLKRRIGELTLRQQKRKAPPQPDIHPL